MVDTAMNQNKTNRFLARRDASACGIGDSSPSRSGGAWVQANIHQAFSSPSPASGGGHKITPSPASGGGPGWGHPINISPPLQARETTKYPPPLQARESTNYLPPLRAGEGRGGGNHPPISSPSLASGGQSEPAPDPVSSTGQALIRCGGQKPHEHNPRNPPARTLRPRSRSPRRHRTPAQIRTRPRRARQAGGAKPGG